MKTIKIIISGDQGVGKSVIGSLIGAYLYRYTKHIVSEDGMDENRILVEDIKNLLHDKKIIIETRNT